MSDNSVNIHAADVEDGAKPSVYVLPTDMTEKARLDKQQEMLTALFDGKVIVPPVKLSRAKILDIGTGTGAWPLDVVRRVSATHTAAFICVDITADNFPSNPPPNMTFLNNTSAAALPADWNDTYTLVHQRLLLGGLKYDEWQLAVTEMYRVLEPGGWVQLCELGPYVKSPGPLNKRMIYLQQSLSQARGLDFDCAQRIPGLLAAAGFVNIQKDMRAVPFGNWGGEMGPLQAVNQIAVWRGLKGAILKDGLVESEEELDDFYNELQAEFDSVTGADITWFMFIGQKPDHDTVQ